MHVHNNSPKSERPNVGTTFMNIYPDMHMHNRCYMHLHVRVMHLHVSRGIPRARDYRVMYQLISKVNLSHSSYPVAETSAYCMRVCWRHLFSDKGR